MEKEETEWRNLSRADRRAFLKSVAEKHPAKALLIRLYLWKCRALEPMMHRTQSASRTHWRLPLFAAGVAFLASFVVWRVLFAAFHWQGFDGGISAILLGLTAYYFARALFGTPPGNG